MSKCEKCLFYGVYRDMAASSGVCTLEDDLTKAIKRYDSKDPCADKLTKSEAIKLRTTFRRFESTKYNLLYIQKDDEEDIIVMRDFEPLCFTNDMEFAMDIVSKLINEDITS